MEVRVHGKNMRVGDRLRDLAVDKMKHAGRIFDDDAFADVEFVVRQNPRIAGRYLVEITCRVHGHTVRVEGVGDDDGGALNVAVDKFERQLRRLKERMIQRTRKTSKKRLNSSGEPTDEHDYIDRAIVRTKRFAMRPMTSEEAVLEMEMLGHDFFFFLNAESGTHCVLYHRNDGSLGLIEPQ